MFNNPKKDLENLFGQTKLHMLVNLKIMSLKVKENIIGQMENLTKENGSITKCADAER